MVWKNYQVNFKRFWMNWRGTKVTRLTEPGSCESHHMYFYNQLTATGGSRLLPLCRLEGERQLYLGSHRIPGDAVQHGDRLENYGV